MEPLKVLRAAKHAECNLIEADENCRTESGTGNVVEVAMSSNEVSGWEIGFAMKNDATADATPTIMTEYDGERLKLACNKPPRFN